MPSKKHSFHGRSLGALSVTGNDHYQEPFAPLLPGIRFGDFNDLNSVKALINDKTCAILMETIQGEGGIYPATEEFLKGVRKLCDEHDLLLILDEIQCGMGRSGSMFAWQAYDGVKPDVMTVAKALGNGVPIGAFLASGKAAACSRGIMELPTAVIHLSVRQQIRCWKQRDPVCSTVNYYKRECR